MGIISIDKEVTAQPTQSFSGAVEYYTLYTTINIMPTGNYSDTTQRIFDTIISLITMRAQPIVVAEPYSTTDLASEGAPSLTGNGYVFKFIVEHDNIFASFDDNYQVVDGVAVLKTMFDAITIEGETFNSSGSSLNIEFMRHTSL